VHIITFFTPQSASGKTTATLAAASGLIAVGKRVAVIDAACGTVRPTRLQDWEDRMVEAGHLADQLKVIPVDCSSDIGKILDDLGDEDMDSVLVDGPSHPETQPQEALDRSTLVILPANGVMKAVFSCSSLGRHLRRPVHVYGLVTGAPDSGEEGRIREGFLDETPVMLASLPQHGLFKRQSAEGDLFRIATPRAVDRAACDAARNLATELAVLAGHALQTTPPPLPRNMADPAVQEEMLANLLDELFTDEDSSAAKSGQA
jgi:cellulose biosynthesis protein BcsQ